MSKSRGGLLDWITVGIAVGALALSAYVVAQRTSAPEDPYADWEVNDWRRYVETGHRLGPVSSPLTLVVFSDYQCPACRWFSGVLDEAWLKHPRGFNVVYRHYPLEQHEYAYSAARAAECANVQGAFEPMHRALFREEQWQDDGDFASVAELAGVPDLNAFTTCMSSRQPHPAIERDTEAAEELNARGTPTVMIEGRVFGVPPDREQLEDLVQSHHDHHDGENGARG